MNLKTQQPGDVSRRRFWTTHEVALLERLYPDLATIDVVREAASDSLSPQDIVARRRLIGFARYQIPGIGLNFP